MDVMTVALIVGAFAVIAIGIFALTRWRAAQAKAAAETYYHMRCNGCKRRLRYKAAQVGNKGACSNCGKPVTFPPISQSIE